MNSRLDTLTSWHADWSGLSVVVLGLGPVGFSVADTLAELRASVTVMASGGAAEYRDLLSVIGAEYVEGAPDAIAHRVREHRPDVVVATPPYGPRHPAIIAARDHGVAVWSDVEVAWRVRDKQGAPADWILVTGSAVPGAPRPAHTALLAASMLAASGRRVLPAGDGAPILDAVRLPERVDVIVAELSSQQLAWTGHELAGRPHPAASVCLSVGAEPVGWHEELEDFRAALGRVYLETRIACVYMAHDLATRELVEDADVQEGCRAIGITLGVPGPSDLGVVEDLLVDRAFLDDRHHQALELATLDELALWGAAEATELIEVLAAAALARAVGAEPDSIVRGVASLNG